jgi:hypothetical protein
MPEYDSIPYTSCAQCDADGTSYCNCETCMRDHVRWAHFKPEPIIGKVDMIPISADLLARTLKSKNSDYKVDSEFSNFEKAAEFAGITPLQVMLAQIGIKYTRIQGLVDAENESLEDSLLDLAGYAIIAHAYLQDGDW